MTDHDQDLRGLLRKAAERAKPEADAEARLLKEARRRRMVTAGAAALAVVVMVGGLAGAATLLGDRQGITPGPGPKDTKECLPDFDIALLLFDDATKGEVASVGERLATDPRVASIRFVAGDAVARTGRRFGPIPAYTEKNRYELSLRPGIHADAETFRDLLRYGGLYIADERDCPPDGRTSNVVRYHFEVDQGESSASGVLRINWAKKTICLDVQTRNIDASHLVFEDPSRPAGTGRWSIAFTFFDPHDGGDKPNLPPSGTHCFANEQLDDLVDDNLLARLIDSPDEFRIDFHRGPDDEPGLVAELMPGDEAFPGMLEDSIEAQGGTIRLRVMPMDVNGRQLARTILNNDTNERIVYGFSYLLEDTSGRGTPPESREECVFRDELLVIEPGGSSRDVIGSRDESCGLGALAAGVYELTIGVELASGDRMPLTVMFPVAAPAEKTPIRRFVTDFMQARVDGVGAEEFLDGHGRRDFGPGGNVAPLYPDPPLQDFRVEFVDDLGDSSYEVGISLVFQQGTYGETLFVREQNGELVISGGRPGLEGP